MLACLLLLCLYTKSEALERETSKMSNEIYEISTPHFTICHLQNIWKREIPEREMFE